MGKQKKISKKEFISKVKDFYISHNNNINIRDFKNSNGLPSIRYIEKTFGIKSIIDIYKFCDLKLTDEKNNFSKRKKYTIKDIYYIFEKRGCKLLSNELKEGVCSKVKYICECGNESEVKVSDFIAKNIRCYECGIKKNTCKRRLDKKKIEKFYVRNHCTLLSDYNEYKNGESILKFKCKCGQIDYKSFLSFKLIPHCKKCNENKKLETHYSWKGGVTPLHEYLRRHLTDWKKSSMSNCNYKCDITGEKFEVIHHLYNFSDIIKETLKITNLEYKKISEYTKEDLSTLEKTCNDLHKKYGLGVCLTKELHDMFHKKYGTENNTPNQYYEFKKTIINFNDYRKLNP